MADRTWTPPLTGPGGASVFASATVDGAATPSDATPLDFNSIYIPPGVTGTLTISRDGGVTSSPAYSVSGPYNLNISGDRIMSTGTALVGGSVIWMKW